MAFAGFFYWESASAKAKDATTKREVAKNQQDLDALHDTVTQLTSYGVLAEQFHALFDNQKDWDAVLAQIEKRLYKNMAVTSLQGTSAGALTISGTTSDYANYAKIYHSFTDPEASVYFTAVRPVSVAKVDKQDDKGNVSSSVINFSFSMNLQPAILSPSPAPTTSTP